MSKKVMVVDDSHFIFEEMKFLLKDSEFEIVSYCRDGEHALEVYEHVKPDIVTMDIILPGIDGFEAAKMILDKWPDAKIVIVSSLAYDDTMENAKKIGARGFIFKPIDRLQVLDALSKAMEETNEIDNRGAVAK